MAKMPWDGDISHTQLSDGRVVLRGSPEEAEHKYGIATTSIQRIFDAHVAAGKCIICGDAAEPGTRYCGGDRGCQHG